MYAGSVVADCKEDNLSPGSLACAGAVELPHGVSVRRVNSDQLWRRLESVDKYIKCNDTALPKSPRSMSCTCTTEPVVPAGAPESGSSWSESSDLGYSRDSASCQERLFLHKQAAFAHILIDTV